MLAVDVHQHLWPEALIAALARRTAPPRLLREGTGWTLRIAGEPPHPFDPADHDPVARAARVREDGLDRALVAISSPLGIEALPPEEAVPLLDAHHTGILELGAPFGLWGALALDDPDPAAIDALLDAGAVGVSLPAAAVATREGLEHAGRLLARLADRDAALLIHPGPAPWRRPAPVDPGAPDWWPALTRYVTEMHEAWVAFLAYGRPAHPTLRVVFAMLAGAAPLHGERLAARGGPPGAVHDPLAFYDVSSYGIRAVDAMVRAVGIDQLLWGSDRPVAEPPGLAALGPAALAALQAANPARALPRLHGPVTA